MKKQHVIWLEEFLRNCLNSNKSSRTIINYRADIQKFIKWHEAMFGYPLNKANAKTIAFYKEYLSAGKNRQESPSKYNQITKRLKGFFKGIWPQKKLDQQAESEVPLVSSMELISSAFTCSPLSVSSRRRHLSSIKNFYEYLKQANEDMNKLFLNNPVKPKLHGIKLKEQDVESTKLLKVNDWIAIDQALYRPRERLIVTLLYYGGLRLTELCQLQISNFDQEHHVIKFVRKGGDLHSLRLQNGEEIFSLLKVFLQSRGNSSDFLFCNKKGLPLSSRAMYTTIMKIFSKSQCETRGLTPHSFRKACATNLYKKTKDLIFVRDYLNHADAKVTQTYIEKYELDEETRKYLQA